MDLIKKLTESYTSEELERIQLMATLRIIEKRSEYKEEKIGKSKRGSIVDLDDDIDRKVEVY